MFNYLRHFGVIFGFAIGGLILSALLGGTVGGVGTAYVINQRRVARKRAREARVRRAREEMERERIKRERNTERVFSSINSTEVTTSQAVSSQRILIGETVTNGVLIFRDSDASTHYLYEMYAIAGHEIEGVLNVIINNQEIKTSIDGYAITEPFFYRRAGITKAGTGEFHGSQPRRYLRINTRVGKIDQDIDPLMLEVGMPTTFRQVGHATVTLRKYHGAIVENPEHDAAPEHQRRLNDERDRVWGEGGETLFKVRGLKVWDPRDFEQDPNRSSTWKWSRNAALVIAGVLQHRLFGSGVSYNDFNVEALIKAANTCDIKFETLDGRQIPQYTLDGVIQTGEQQASVISDMLNCCNGRIYLVGGKYVIDIATPRIPYDVINDDDFVGEHTFSNNIQDTELYSRVQSRFQDITVEGQRSEAVVISLSDIDEDCADRVQTNNTLNLDLRFVRDPYRAQRIMRVVLSRNCFEKNMTLNINAKGLKYVPGDVVWVASNRQPHINAQYEILKVGTRPEGGAIELELREFSNNIFRAGAGLPFIPRLEKIVRGRTAGEAIQDFASRIDPDTFDQPRISVASNIANDLFFIFNQ